MFFYNLFLKVYKIGIRLSAKEGNKAQRWLIGRKNIFEKIEHELKYTGKKIWIHCASVGEFEQARPIIERLKNQKPELKIVLTFFSPSGYELRKNYDYADHVFYLPLDGKKNAEKFVELIHPSVVLFVKYEFWYYYLKTLNDRNIPTLLISATFRENQPFFNWYGSMFRKMLSYYQAIFVQEERSRELLSSISIIENVVVGGDTRYDRVMEIAAQSKGFPEIESWIENNEIIIAGSTWPQDELILKSCLEYLPKNWKIIVAPHEIDKSHLQQIRDLFGEEVVMYSELANNVSERKVLVIDNIGMLSSLYRYGAIAFVGGGFTKGGIHNILEPAAFGLPVFIGTNYEKFAEARMMTEKCFVFPVKSEFEFKGKLLKIIDDTNYRKKLKEDILRFMSSQTGAADRILKYITSIDL